jgi:hypothetical protein
MVGRACTYQMPDGRACRATPLRDQPFCFWHSPDTTEDLTEARRMGGLHRRKKRTVATIYGFGGLRSIEDHQALLETLVIETMTLENSIARNSVVARMIATGAKLIELDDLATRVAAIEAALGPLSSSCAVMRILATTHDLLEREGLIQAALSAHIALLMTEGREHGRRDATYIERFATRRDLLMLRVSELRAAEEARALVEARYLSGHTALFPDAVKAWDAQIANTVTLAGIACRLAELDGVPPAEPPDPDAVSARVAELVADLVEPAKTTALEKLGEGDRAIGIAIGWLRPRLLPGGWTPVA